MLPIIASHNIIPKKPYNNRYLYILKKIFGIVFASGGTRNEDP
jgi:hypothetical protein